MRGYPQYNFPAFEKAAARLRESGHEVFSPAEHDLQNGFDPGLGEYEQGFNLRDAMLLDLTWIIQKAEAVVCLPSWRDSRGAMAEVHTAFCIGIPVYDEDLEEIVFNGNG